MEILSPTILKIVIQAAISLSLMSIILLGIIVAIRWGTDRRDRRSGEFRREAKPLVMGYLAGTTDKEEVLEILNEVSVSGPVRCHQERNGQVPVPSNFLDQLSCIRIGSL